jgi:hypothetical protein
MPCMNHPQRNFISSKPSLSNGYHDLWVLLARQPWPDVNMDAMHIVGLKLRKVFVLDPVLPGQYCTGFLPLCPMRLAAVM